MIDFDFQNENKYYIILITISKDYNQVANNQGDKKEERNIINLFVNLILAKE